MQTKLYTHRQTHWTPHPHTISGNMCESARERAWEQRMAILEAIHAEISPQLQALRDADEENFIGPVVHFEL